MTEQQTEQQTCSYPKCNCAFDMRADNKCLRSLPNKRENIACRPGATDAMQRLATENEALWAELEIAKETRKALQLQLEQYQHNQAVSGLCIDAALRGETRPAESYWDGRMEAVRQLAADRNRLAEHAERIADAVGFPAHNENRQKTFVIVESIENMKRFSEYLHAIEQAFLMVPAEPDEDYPNDPTEECLVNCWGSTRDEYVWQFAKAIAHIKAAGAAELLRCATEAPGFSGTVVRVDVLEKIVGRMEGK